MMAIKNYNHLRRGFTLIELSIVLVIIGLIVGGVLVGRDLITASYVRAQISQIEKIQTGINTFRTKYDNYLPGDLPAKYITAGSGFQVRAGTEGRGDGNGIVQGWCVTCGGGDYTNFQGGEAAYFWEDLSNVKLVDGKFDTVRDDYNPSPSTINATTSPTKISDWLPPAKIGDGNYIYVILVGGVNKLGLGNIPSMLNWGPTTIQAGLTVSQAYNIDKKIDDGMPQAGTVTTQHPAWAKGGGATGEAPGVAATASSTSCYDNGGNTSALMQYSMAVNNGAGVNCGLSFRFQ